MNGGEIFIFISINCLIIYLLHVLHKRSIAKTLQHLRKEVNELENLVAAIIEEFEEVAEGVLSSETEKPAEKSFEPQIITEKETVQVINEPVPDSFKLSVAEPEETLELTVSESLENFKAKENEIPETLPIFQPQDIIDPKHQQIVQLWKEGLAIQEIAKQLGTGRGEVQLILGIYKRS